MQTPATIPIQKHVVLVGAGNAHLSFVKMFGMKPIPGVAVTLVSEAPVIPYSAMVPGHIAGDYTWDEITIDLVRLCRSMNVRFVSGRATAIDVGTKTVSFADRPELRYDALALGVGSLPACPLVKPSETSWLMRPLDRLLERLDALAPLSPVLRGEGTGARGSSSTQREDPLTPTLSPGVPGERELKFVIVGGGASGCELSLAIHKRLADVPNLKLTLVHSHDRLIPQFPDKVHTTFLDLLHRRNIDVHLNARLLGGDEYTLNLTNGQQLNYDVVLWATHAAPQPLLQTTGLPLNNDGFLQVQDTLQSLGDPAVFGTGDCISFVNYPDLPKNGVYAVREGMRLFDNVQRFLHDKPLQPFVPQKRCLCLLNTADNQALLTYGSIVWKSRFARWWKNRIDRAWVDKFTKFPAMAESSADDAENHTMRCGGCGNKISSDVLSAVLKRIDVGDDPRVLLGCAAGEDAAVHRMKPELFGSDPTKLVEVQTVDYFKSFVDDPYLFGRIAALNSVSDLYAMNARPFSALAIATLPQARGPVQEAMLYELMTGAVQSLRSLGVILTGGHTTEGPDLALGFAVTGHAEEDRLFQKSHLRAGDVLILAKPIGSGALLAAWMRGACRATWFEALKKQMLLPNAEAGAILARHGVRACTDVTGFGLAGHLLEMLDASRLSARLQTKAVPLYDGFNEVVSQGIVSSLHRDNAKAACRVESVESPAWLYDPQTAGGLLASVAPHEAEAVLSELRASGYESATIIGEVLPLGASALMLS